MRVLSRLELARCTRAELQTMLYAIAAQLPFLADGSTELRGAHTNLQAIRNALARPTFGPR